MKGQPARRENGARAILSIWRAVCILALAGTLWFIFSHSAQPAPVSGAQSRGVMAFVNEVLGSWGLPGVSEHLLRKAAHFAEFTALGWWAFLCARAFSRRAARWLPWLWGAGALCAAADEGIQLFAPGRAARVSDILLDSCGMLAGACRANRKPAALHLRKTAGAFLCLMANFAQKILCAPAGTTLPERERRDMMMLRYVLSQ